MLMKIEYKFTFEKSLPQPCFSLKPMPCKPFWGPILFFFGKNKRIFTTPKTIILKWSLYELFDWYVYTKKNTTAKTTVNN